MRLQKKQFIMQCVSLAVLVLISSAYAAHHILERVSVSSDGSQAIGVGALGYSSGSSRPSISESGRYVVFDSDAVNLVPNDLNTFQDVFIRDRVTGITERVSVSSNGSEANSGSGWYGGASISGDGRYVSFNSSASNLVANDTNLRGDIFVRDRTTGTTKRVSINSDGTEANGWCGGTPAISSNGRYVAFESDADNLVPGDTNGAVYSFEGGDIFVHDLQNETTERVSINSQEEQAIGGYSSSYAPAISADGRFVAFHSKAQNLDPISLSEINIFVRDRLDGTTQQVSISSNGSAADNDCEDASISGDGRYVSFSSWASNLVANDTNSTKDIFVHDRTTGTTERVSINSDGTEADARSEKASISPDGRLIVFLSSATNLTVNDSNNQKDIFVHDRATGKTVCFTCTGTPVAGYTPIYEGIPAGLTSSGLVAFTSPFSGLVSGDTNEIFDVFVGTLFDEKTSSFNWAAFLPAIINMGPGNAK